MRLDFQFRVCSLARLIRGARGCLHSLHLVEAILSPSPVTTSIPGSSRITLEYNAPV